MKRILVVAAHPDDEVLGCGGTIAKLVSEGNAVYTLILGEGIISRGNKRTAANDKNAIIKLKASLQKANKILGVHKAFAFDFPDNRFDSVSLLDIVKVIEKIKDQVRPQVIITHHANDLNIDHRITCSAVLVASRPVAGETVKEIYSFEVLSSTEWNCPADFSPNLFFDISITLAAKLKAMQAYHGELRDYPHPRSLEGIKLNARYWGMRVGLKYAEAFILLRKVQ